eukprot:1278079-Rhodomonas_salina.2
MGARMTLAKDAKWMARVARSPDERKYHPRKSMNNSNSTTYPTDGLAGPARDPHVGPGARHLGDKEDWDHGQQVPPTEPPKQLAVATRPGHRALVVQYLRATRSLRIADRDSGYLGLDGLLPSAARVDETGTDFWRACGLVRSMHGDAKLHGRVAGLSRPELGIREEALEASRAIGAGVDDLGLMHHHHDVSSCKELGLMGGENDCRLLSEHDALDAVLDYVLASVHVDRREGRVEHHDAGSAVGGTRQGNALLLTTRQVASTLADPGEVTVVEQLEVRLQCAGVHHSVVLLLDVLLAKQDVVAHRAQCTPRHLRHIRERVAGVLVPREVVHLPQHSPQEAGLSASNRTCHHRQRSRGDVEVDLLKVGLGRVDCVGEGTVDHLDSAESVALVMHNTLVRELWLDEEFLDALHGQQRVGEIAQTLRQLHQGEAKHVEKGERGEGQRAVHGALDLIHTEDNHDEERWHPEYRRGQHGFAVRLLVKQPHLLFTEGQQPLAERLLPSIHLDQLDRAEDLLHQQRPLGR